ncbi:MAG: hypothetical protein AAFX80_18585 [Cyanobacteria bacterium J06639_18]
MSTTIKRVKPAEIAFCGSSVQLWHTTGAVAAQPNAILSRSGMEFGMNRGADLVP